MQDDVPLIEARGISKYYGSLCANSTIDFEVYGGEVHALLGENGAGKTTLAGILFGAISPDAGQILVDGTPAVLDSPRAALDHGIAMVYQRYMLIPELTVAENVVLGSRPSGLARLSRKKINHNVATAAETYAMSLPVSERVENLPVDVQQKVEILRCLYRGARLLILDEPTAVLGPLEIENLFDVVRALRAQKKGVVIITHKVAEVMSVADRATVLHGGAVAASIGRENFESRSLTNAMVQESVSAPVQIEVATTSTAEVQDRAATEAILRVSQLVALSSDGTDRNSLHELSLSVYPGEIVGVAGVEGNGQSELVQVLAGMRPAASGSISVRGHPITDYGPKQRRSAGLVAIPEDRHEAGLIDELSVADNLALAKFADGHLTRFGFLQRDRVLSEAKAIIDEFQIRPPNPTASVGTLSGGNQQKVVLARALGADPSVLVAAYPTRGLDVAATQFVHEQLMNLRQRNLGVLLVSTDMDELFALCDRIVVLFRGTVALQLDRDSFNIADIAQAMASGGNSDSGLVTHPRDTTGAPDQTEARRSS